MPVLEIGGEKISCDIKRKNVRHVYLRVRAIHELSLSKPGFRLEVVLPRDRNVSVDDILEKKRSWIERKVKEISKVKKIFDGNNILYRGEPLRVQTYPVRKSFKGVKLYKKTIHVYEDSEKKREEILRDFITRHTHAYVQEKAEKLAKELGVSYNAVSTKEMKKWGYCTREGNLFFNWRLICLPEDLINYVIFHEILHLKHFNHSKQFKKDMTRYFIDYKRLGNMLKSYLPQ